MQAGELISYHLMSKAYCGTSGKIPFLRGGAMKAVFLLAPCVLALAVPIYNAIEPRLFGFPVFYWYLLLLIPVSSVFIFLAYRSEKR
jgi:hypothetical protein